MVMTDNIFNIQIGDYIQYHSKQIEVLNNNIDFNGEKSVMIKDDSPFTSDHFIRYSELNSGLASKIWKLIRKENL